MKFFLLLLSFAFPFFAYAQDVDFYGKIKEVTLVDENGNREGSEEFVAGEPSLTIITNEEGETFYKVEGEFVLKVNNVDAMIETILQKHGLSSLQGSYCAYFLHERDKSNNLESIAEFYKNIEQLWKPVGSYSKGQKINVVAENGLFSMYHIYSFPKPLSNDKNNIWCVPNRTLAVWIASKNYLFSFDLAADLPADVQEELYNAFLDQFMIFEDL